jgi:alkanesulfonate monooxygenase SsuD/methylene tetrahydromethanopterin reductase-like flavin-dependent oxidoreductase (luciferase family)
VAPTEIATLVATAVSSLGLGSVVTALIKSRDKGRIIASKDKAQERQDAVGAFLALVTDLRGLLKDEGEARKRAERKALDATGEHRDCLRQVETVREQMEQREQACKDEIEFLRSSLQGEIEKIRTEVRSQTNPPPAAQ